MLSTAILLGGVGTRETKHGAVSGKEMADGVIVEFFSVVGLKCEYGSPELCGDIGIECNESSSNIGFPTKRKCPHKVRVIIQYNKIIKITRITRY